MKRLIPPLITIGLSVLLALLSAALTYSSPSQAQKSLPDSAYFLQATPTQPQEDRSEIGSTDEIAIMGGVIALIVIVPIFLRRNSWR
ncbi:MAG TPA: hypothetical protein VFY26_09710 [Anaerolineales bacterium]|nr:hypothetical protein [Anaerolineales bacterium]